MTEKLKDYQVLDVLCGGTFYKVRHKVTNNIFAWKAFNCSSYSDKQIQIIGNEVKTISKVITENVLRYYDTILHAPSKTLYFVLEFNSWRSIEELIALCKETNRYIAENFIWYLLHELASVCKAVENFNFVVLQKCINRNSVFVDESGELRVNCFDLSSSSQSQNLLRQVGNVIHALCYRAGPSDDKIKEFHYSGDLHDIVSFMNNEKNVFLKPDVVLYHPTVLANLETLAGPKNLSDILMPIDGPQSSDVNKCDSEKAVELCRAIEPAPRNNFIFDSPIYSNISPKKAITVGDYNKSERGSLSPTIAALALELPGFVPRSRRPLHKAIEACNSPQKVSEKTLSQQWMSRLIFLRQREESLNKRERDLIAKEIINSPAAKIISQNDDLAVKITPGDDAQEVPFHNGITLPPLINSLSNKDEQKSWISRRHQHHRRSSSVRTRSRHRKSLGYEDLDSSLSADPGDGSVIITAKKITKENMPRRSIFPEVSTKKVHFTSSNPFAESDESVTLTFYELENIDGDGYQVPRQNNKMLNEITKFKYLDLEKVTSEKRAAMQQWHHSSPPKQAKKVFADITNNDNITFKRTPSKTSLVSKSSNTSNATQNSTTSSKSSWSMESACSKVSQGNISDRTRASIRQSLMPIQAPPATEVKKPKSRKSLLPFKTPFKFMSSNKA